ncbi:MAG: NUDIX hydrolase [Candidatus Doudnabacteria bacterium]|nr:NUDIX hydrolase [Candidatus Doudnabacteria bacterium]
MTKTPQKYNYAVIATDIAIFTMQNEQLKVLLIKMKKAPYTGSWALPGGLIKGDENLDDAAERILLDKAGLSHVYLEQLYTFGRVDRDPFGRVVSVSYFALIPNSGITPKTSSEYSEIAWFSVKNLPKLAYDHKEIVQAAIQRLQSKLSYTNIIYGLLPKEFTLGELQTIYEIILGKKLDKRNFRKKILSLKLVKKLNRKKSTGPNRPAELYCFTQSKPQLVDIL